MSLAKVESQPLFHHLEKFKKSNVKDAELKEELKFVLDQFGAKSKIVDQKVFDKYDRTSNFIIWKDENEIKFIDKDHFVALYIRARQLKNRKTK